MKSLGLDMLHKEKCQGGFIAREVDQRYDYNEYVFGCDDPNHLILRRRVHDQDRH